MAKEIRKTSTAKKTVPASSTAAAESTSIGPVLVIDVGGTNVKVQSEDNLTKPDAEPIKIPSGTVMTAQMMVDSVLQSITWPFAAVSIGYPGPVRVGRPLQEPANLGGGWVGFDFEKAFSTSSQARPVKIVNDAAMQALGSYQGGCMLFLGLGTGLGSAMIVNGHLEPMELAHLAYKKRQTYEDFVGLRGLRRLGKKKWRREVIEVVDRLRAAMLPDYVVLGGGNAKFLKELPADVHLGSNENAFIGGVRLWRGLDTIQNGHVEVGAPTIARAKG